MTSPNLSSDFLQQLKTLGQEAESRVPEMSAQRNLPRDLMNRLKKTQIFKTWVAESYGGKQGTIFDLMESIQTLAYYQGSISWVAMVCSTAGLCSGFMSEAAAASIFGEEMAMVGGLAAPAGKARRVEGGILVNGHWSWGSGTRHCSRVVGGVLLFEGENEKPRSALAIFHPKDVDFKDNWRVMGLQGTCSIDYSVENLFVPDEEWIYFPVQKPQIDDTLYHFSFFGALSSGVASVALGLAERAREEFRILAQAKKPSGSRNTLSQKTMVHAQLGQAEAAYLAAKLFLESAVQKAWEEAEERRLRKEAKVQVRLAASHAVQASVQLVDGIYNMAGGSSIWDGVKIQELFRDIHVLTQHALVSPQIFETYGRVALGQEVNEWTL